MNFLPVSVWQEREAKKKRMRRIRTALIAGFLAGVIFSYPKYMEVRETYRLESLTERYRELEKGRPFREEVVAKERQYREEKAVVDRLRRENVSVIAVIDAVNSVLPPGLWVTDIEIEAKKAVRLKCEATSTLAAARFMAGLDSLGLFSGVEANEIPLGKGLHRVEFYLPFASDATHGASR